MKVGDLVELSAYGSKVQRTQWVLKGDVGIVTKIVGHSQNYYYVQWARSGNFTTARANRRWRWFHEREFDRRDLKMVRRKKNGS